MQDSNNIHICNIIYIIIYDIYNIHISESCKIWCAATHLPTALSRVGEMLNGKSNQTMLDS